MATRNYIITIDDSELTDELRETLQRLGAKLEGDSEPPITEADKRVLTERWNAVKAGEAEFYPIEEVFKRLEEKHFKS